MASRLALFLLTTSLVFGATNARAYKIVLPNLKVHETLTALAVECFISRGFSDTQRCAAVDVKPQDAKLVYSPKRVGAVVIEGVPLTVEEIARGSRWSDDPQRKLVGVAAGNWLAGLFKYCEKYSGLGVHNAGLLCASHFGSMQYLHAMAASSIEPTSDTQSKMLEWARFAFDYAKGAIADGANLCTALKSYPLIRESLIGEDDSFICLGTRRRLAYIIPFGRFPPRTVGQLFGFTCENPVLSRKCDVGGTSVRMRKIAAIGSILHLIQDSFSQAHASRGECGDRPAALIRTAKISQFLEYSGQDHTSHGNSDAWPRTERVDAGIHDPIQAGAHVLRLLTEREATGLNLQTYLLEHVFALEREDKRASQSGAGACYAKN